MQSVWEFLQNVDKDKDKARKSHDTVNLKCPGCGDGLANVLLALQEWRAELRFMVFLRKVRQSVHASSPCTAGLFISRDERA